MARQIVGKCNPLRKFCPKKYTSRGGGTVWQLFTWLLEQCTIIGASLKYTRLRLKCTKTLRILAAAARLWVGGGGLRPGTCQTGFGLDYIHQARAAGLGKRKRMKGDGDPMYGTSFCKGKGKDHPVDLIRSYGGAGLQLHSLWNLSLDKVEWSHVRAALSPTKQLPELTEQEADWPCKAGMGVLAASITCRLPGISNTGTNPQPSHCTRGICFDMIWDPHSSGMLRNVDC